MRRKTDRRIVDQTNRRTDGESDNQNDGRKDSQTDRRPYKQTNGRTYGLGDARGSIYQEKWTFVNRLPPPPYIVTPRLPRMTTKLHPKRISQPKRKRLFHLVFRFLLPFPW